MAPTTTPNVLRRIQRLAWFGLTACAVIVGTSAACGLTPLLQVENDLALLVILASTWAIMTQVGRYVRTEEERISVHEDSARRETAHAVARVAKDRVKNKLSLIAGYSEFVANDPRLPDDLREAAQKAVDGAFAVARAVDDLDASVPIGRVDLP
jgi:hypothetical protein